MRMKMRKMEMKMTNKLTENLSGFSPPHSFVRSFIHPLIHSNCVCKEERLRRLFVRTFITLSLFHFVIPWKIKNEKKKISLLLLHMSPIVHIIFTYSVLCFCFASSFLVQWVHNLQKKKNRSVNVHGWQAFVVVGGRDLLQFLRLGCRCSVMLLIYCF